MKDLHPANRQSIAVFPVIEMLLGSVPALISLISLSNSETIQLWRSAIPKSRAYLILEITSGPKLTWGLITLPVMSTALVAKSIATAAIVVVPISTAIPKPEKEHFAACE